MKALRRLICLASCSLMLTAGPAFAQVGGTNSSANEKTQNQSSGTNTGTDTTFRSGGDTSTDSPTGTSTDDGAKAAHKGHASDPRDKTAMRDAETNKDAQSNWGDKSGKMGQWEEGSITGKVVCLSCYMGEGKVSSEAIEPGETLALITDEGKTVVLVGGKNNSMLNELRNSPGKSVTLNGEKIHRNGLCAFKVKGMGDKSMDSKSDMNRNTHDEKNLENSPNTGDHTTD